MLTLQAGFTTRLIVAMRLTQRYLTSLFVSYLNEDFEGGQTTFFTNPERVVQPVKGDALLFQHPLVHEGSIVTAGVKYVARTDVMYRK